MPVRNRIPLTPMVFVVMALSIAFNSAAAQNVAPSARGASPGAGPRLTHYAFPYQMCGRPSRAK